MRPQSLKPNQFSYNSLHLSNSTVDTSPTFVRLTNTTFDQPVTDC